MRSRPFYLTWIILLASLTAYSSIALAQSDWFSQNPILNDLKDVTYAGADTWFAVGKYGSIYKSTDGGETWTGQESGTTVTLYGASFTSTDTGVVVGEGGLVLKTIDGGSTWELKSSGTSYTLYDVAFTSANTGTAVGYSSTIVNTADGGETWQVVNDLPYNMYEPYYGVSFIDQDNGVAGGGGTPYTDRATACMLRTFDAGATWTMIDKRGPFCCYAIEMRSTNIAMAVGYSFDMFPEVDVYRAKIYKSTDGGISWMECYSYSVYEQENKFDDIAYTDLDTWVAVGRLGVIVRTTNDGASWTRSWNPSFNDLHAVSFSSPDTGIAVGSGGIALKTTNGGVTWIRKSGESLTSENLYDIVFTDELTAHVVGENIQLRTYDGGLTWETAIYSYSSDYLLVTIDFANADTGLVAGYIYNLFNEHAYLARTTNGGLTYSGVDGDFEYGERFQDVKFIDETTAVALSYNLSNIWWSFDAGASWAKRGNQVGGKAIAFSSDSCGTIVSLDGQIYRTMDRGVTWDLQYDMGEIAWYEVMYLDDTHGWIVGSGGSILATADGGESWFPQSSGSGTTLRSVFFTDPENGTIVGYDGVILRTPDGGDTWVPEESGTMITLYGVYFTDSETGTVVGGVGTILRTEGEPVAVMLQQFGALWRDDHAEVYWSVSVASLESELDFTVSRSSEGGGSFVTIPNPDIERTGTDFILRDYGTEPGTEYIYRVDIYEDGRLAASFDAAVETPTAAFHLSQNHPNPFNPSTEIRFSIPGKCRAQLSIYDVSGRLVRGLLDKEMPAGHHTARWDGRNEAGIDVASGIYFYMLRAGKLSESKKMVLLR